MHWLAINNNKDRYVQIRCGPDVVDVERYPIERNGSKKTSAGMNKLKPNASAEISSDAYNLPMRCRRAFKTKLCDSLETSALALLFSSVHSCGDFVNHFLSKGYQILVHTTKFNSNIQ